MDINKVKKMHAETYTQTARRCFNVNSTRADGFQHPLKAGRLLPTSASILTLPPASSRKTGPPKYRRRQAPWMTTFSYRPRPRIGVL